jgi:hypothetical protein
LSGTQLYGDGSLWWIACYAIVVGTLRGCRLRVISKLAPRSLSRAHNIKNCSGRVSATSEKQWVFDVCWRDVQRDDAADFVDPDT